VSNFAAVIADMNATLRPSDEQLAVAKAMLTATDDRDAHVYVPLALPGKQRGIWVLGQPVEHVPGYWISSAQRDEHGGLARDYASRAADAWLGARDGVPCYVSIDKDGRFAPYEDTRLSTHEGLLEHTERAIQQGVGPAS
jgi:hypothetical protein